MDGRLITWGANEFGQLGRGFFSPHHGTTLSPTKMAAELKAAGREGPRATAPAAARANDDDGGAQSTAAAQVEKRQSKVRWFLFKNPPVFFVFIFFASSLTFSVLPPFRSLLNLKLYFMARVLRNFCLLFSY